MRGSRVDAAGLALLAGGLSNAQYAARAQQFRPAPDQVRVEALRLLGEGLSIRDVAGAMHVAESVVQAWLSEAA